MKLEVFFAKKIYSDAGVKKQFSRPAIRIATASIAIGISIMIMSLCVLMGFKKEIITKVEGFTSQAQVLSTIVNENYDVLPIIINDSLLKAIESAVPQCCIKLYASKLGILKTENDFCSINIKGIDENNSLDFFRNNLVDGEIPKFTAYNSSNNIVISEIVANILKLEVGSYVYAYFFSSQKIRARKFKVVGVYKTNLSEYDKSLAFTDLFTIRRLNNWDSTMVSGCEISAENSFHINKYSDKLKMNINSLESNKERVFAAFTIDELNPHFFSWLGVLDTNIIIILVLIICVSGATVASGLLIIIIERIEMIGILKSIGATNSFVRKIFMNFSIMIIIRGLLIGNFIAFIVCLIQKHTHIIKLDSSYYYLNSVPIEFNWTYILMMNILVLILTTLITLSTSYLVSMDKPVKSMAFKL